MNREIKFRGYDEENRKWRFGHFFETVEGIRKCLNIVEDREIRYFVSLDSMGQYTGLKDKNGKEIYEGDIISNPRYEENYVVEYHIDGYVGWGDDRLCGCYLITDEGIEVIGNIHENPELLK